MSTTTREQRATRTPLALRNVVHSRWKSLVAISGLCFAITLEFMQLGFFQSVKLTATNLYDHLDFQVALVPKEYEQFYDPGTFPLERLHRALEVEGVVQATPLYSAMCLWRCPVDPKTSRGGVNAKLRALCVLGVNVEDNPFLPPIRDSIAEHRGELHKPDTLLMDVRSHADFGWRVRDKYADWELSGRAVRILGGFSLGSGFAADATVMCSDENFVRYVPWASTNEVNLGLLRIAAGADAGRVARDLNALLPPDVEALTHAALDRRERDYWIKSTATGILFGFGVFVALCTGSVVVYQVLSNDIASHFAEYATLKAMGYTNGFLCWVVMQQATIFGLVSYFPALLISWIAYEVVALVANIPMVLTVENVVFVFVASMGMCWGSALLTIRKVRTADPAELF